MNIKNILKAFGLGAVLGISCIPEVSDTDNPTISDHTDSGIDDSDSNKTKYPKFNQGDSCIPPTIEINNPPFSDRTRRDAGTLSFPQNYSSGNITYFGGPGVAVGDVNNDGYDDIYLPAERRTNTAGGRLVINDSRGNFSESNNNPEGPELGVGAMFFDYDNDGDQDLFITGSKDNLSTDEGLKLYENNGRGNFSDITREAGIRDIPRGLRFSSAVCDIDNDGDLDLIVAGLIDGNTREPRGLGELLYVNNLEKGKTFFTEEAEERSLNLYKDQQGGVTFVALCVDINRDGNQDIILGNDYGLTSQNEVYKNDGRGNFTEQASALGLDFARNKGIRGKGNFTRDGADTMGMDIGDIDLNGIPDIVMSNLDSPPSSRTTIIFQGYLENNQINFRGLSTEIGLTSTGHVNWGAKFIDPDKNMTLDLIIAVSMRDRNTTPPEAFWRNNGFTQDRGFEYTPTCGINCNLGNNSFGLALTDLELDGRVDVVIANANFPPTILSAQPTNGNYILYKLTGTVSNRDAVGSIVRIAARDGCTIEKYRHNSGGFASSDSAYIHSGLGPAQYAETTVIWPTGETEEFGELEANHVYELIEGSGEAEVIK